MREEYELYLRKLLNDWLFFSIVRHVGFEEIDNTI
jgi:hypothetical protein